MENALANWDVRALLATARRDRAALHAALATGVHARAIIDEIKNRPDELDFFLEVLGVDPGAGSYFFSGVTDNRTFDIYQKHHIAAINLWEDVVTPAQWQYLISIGYVNKGGAEDDAEDDADDRAEEGDAEEGDVEEGDAEDDDTENGTMNGAKIGDGGAAKDGAEAKGNIEAKDSAESDNGAEATDGAALCIMCDVWRVADAETCTGCSGAICAICLGSGYCIDESSASVACRCAKCGCALCAKCATVCDRCPEVAASVSAYCAKCRAGPLASVGDDWRCRMPAHPTVDLRCEECGAQRSTMIECSECETAHFCMQCAPKHHCNCGTAICASCVCSMCDGRGVR